MATTPPNFDDLKKQIEDLNQRIIDLGGTGMPDLNAQIRAMGGNVNSATAYIKLLQNEVNSLENIFGSLSTTLRETIDNLKGQFDPLKQVNKGFNSLESISRRLADHSLDESILTTKQIKLNQKKAIEEINNQRKILQGFQARESAGEDIKGKELQYFEELQKALAAAQDETNRGYLYTLLKQSEELLIKEKQIQKTLGITGQAFKGISSTLQQIGIESAAIDEINASMREAAKSGSGFKVILASIKGTLKATYEGLLNDPAVQIAFITKTFKTLYNIGSQFNQQTADMARNMGINTEQARQFNKAILSASQESEKYSSTQAATQKNFIEANNNMNEALGTSVVYSRKMLEDQTALVKQAGLTNEEAAQLARFSILTGKTQENIYDSIGKQTKGVLSNKKVLIEVLKTSGQLSAQYKNNPELIAKAVIQAQKLGLTLEQTKNSSRGLLDFESSITSELEAELLTGKNLNFEKARYLALQGKSAEAAEEIAKQVGSSTQFSQMNVIQQEALAKATNMTVDELADSLRKREEIAKIQRNELGENGKRLSYEEAATKLREQQMSASEKMATSIEKVKESLASMISGPLGTVVDGVTNFFNNLSPALKGALGIAGLGAAILAAAAGIVALSKSIYHTLFGAKKKDLSSEFSKGMTDALRPFNNPGTLKVTMYGIKGQAAQMLKQNAGQGDEDIILGDKKSRRSRRGRRGKKGKMNLLGSALDLAPMIENEEEPNLEFPEETTPKPKKGFGRIKNAFKKGGRKGGFKALGRMGKGLLKGAGKATGIFGALASLGLDIADGGLNWESLGRAGISGLGSLLGGAAGSFVAPGAGTIGGGIAGGMAGDWLANQIFGERKEEPEGLATGGVVTSTGLAKVDKGEVYLGGNSLGVLKNMLDALQEQNNHLKALLNKNQNIYLDSTKVGTAFSLNT